MKKALLFLGLAFALIATAIPALAVKVYYNNPNNWETVKAHFYKSDGNNGWPGDALTKNPTTGVWSIDVPAGYESAQVIFNNGNGGEGNQYPDVNGLQLNGNTAMFCINNSIWTPYQATAFKVYYDNSYANWSSVNIHYFGDCQASDWDNAPAMTNIAGTAIYEYEVPAGTGGIVFKNGNGTGVAQSSDHAAVAGHVYNNTTDLGEYVPVSNDPFTVYFDNFGTGWTVPYIYYWGGASTTDYPGVEMTAVTGKDGIYKFDVPARTKNIIFSAGGENADATKTADYKAVADHIYLTGGAENNQGVEYASYTRQVDKPAALYLLTNDGLAEMNPTKTIAMTADGNSFSVANVKVEVAEVGGDYGYFTFVTTTGANWDALNAADRYGAGSADEALVDGVGNVVKYSGYAAGSAQSWKVAPGTYTFTVNFETMKVTVSGNATVAGSGTVNVPNVEIEAGKDGALEFQIASESNMIGLQLDIALPSVVMASQPVLAISSTDHTIQGSSIAGGKYRVIIKSNTNALFPIKTGTIFRLPISISATAAADDYEISVTDIILSDENRLKATLTAGTIGHITVTEATEEASIKFDGEVEEVSLQRGETATLTVTDLEGNPISEGINWSSSDTSVATVVNGVITAVANGSCTVSATVGNSKVSVNVTVGKKTQTITWTQELPAKVEINGTPITLTATASSGLAVTYAIVSGAGYASIEGNVLTPSEKAGVVTIQARQAGNEEWAPANPVSKTITVWLGYFPGDVTGDDELTVADVTATTNHILGRTPDTFIAERADLNKDDAIDIVDVTLIIDLVLKYQGTGAGSAAPARVNDNEGMERFSMHPIDNTMLRITFTNMDQYIATQFDLNLPEGIVVTSAGIFGSDHNVVFLNNEGKTRVVVQSDNNLEFLGNGYIMVMLSSELTGGVSLNNALINRLDGNNIIETRAIGTTTEITGIENIAVDGDANCQVYSIDGVCIYNGTVEGFRAQNHRGVYILRTAGKAQKVLIR